VNPSTSSSSPAFDHYWTEKVRRLHPYVPGEQPRDQQTIKLNTNENPYAPSPRVIQAIQAVLDDRLRLYPDPEALQLRQAIAEQLETGVENIFPGNGSDEVLALTFQAFFGSNKALLYPDISYSFYPVYCNLYGIEARQIPLTANLTLDLMDYDADNGGIIFPNPNAPTSKAITLDAIEALLQRNTESVVVVDEAYVDFGTETAVPLTARYPNLLVTRTFSKSASLAGMRVGFAVGHAGLIEALVRVKDSFNSYPLDLLAQTAATAAITDQAYLRTTCQRIIRTRHSTSVSLRALGFDVLDSASNFLFVTHAGFDAGELAADLRSSGILVRHWRTPRIRHYLRITVGTDDEMQKLVTELRARVL